jgi:uncharacterized membrane protein (GlpM family)
MNDRRIDVAALLDAFFVVLFVAVGRRNHDQDPAIAGTLFTAAPFLIALGAGWVVARAWREPLGLVTGVIVWLVTVGLGMVLRNLVFDRGTAASFVVVTTLFVGACLVGWRLIAQLVVLRRRRRPNPA